jgi:hypothetical protein
MSFSATPKLWKSNACGIEKTFTGNESRRWPSDPEILQKAFDRIKEVAQAASYFILPNSYFVCEHIRPLAAELLEMLSGAVGGELTVVGK